LNHQKYSRQFEGIIAAALVNEFGVEVTFDEK
jgi:hypothetical protein